ncbi:hypothetical protein GCM10009772_05060 [Pseudonocardia alni subsp. carboxydivorans]|uniref:FkbM family methyltransferase n=1 Tax=Pseudonocardia alni subsp. carboxydivorans TaxID=415010 RepID=A0ABU9ABD2_PSEA5
MYQPFVAGRWYEEQFLEHIRMVGRTGVYVDAGANIGTATTWFAMLCPSTHVHAIEPVGRFADQLERVIVENDLLGHVTLHRLGVSDKSGTATNHLDRSHQVGFDADPVGRNETFSVATLDELVTGPVAVIKVDVEGMENRVLKGAGRILENDRPLVYFEAFNRARFREVADVLKPFGYAPTGKVFNSTPTYEFSTESSSGVSARLATYRFKRVVRRITWKAAKRVGIR